MEPEREVLDCDDSSLRGAPWILCISALVGIETTGGVWRLH
jgi:hypothetical protein